MLLKYAIVIILAIITLIINFGSKKIAVKLFSKDEPSANDIFKIKFAALILCIFTFTLALLLF